MRSDIHTATAMSNDAAAALRKAVQKLWQAAMSQHQDRFVVHSPHPRSNVGHQRD